VGSTPQLSAPVELRNAVARVALSGELDMASVSTLEDQLAHVEGDGVTVIMLDLRGLTFIDSTGLRAFLQARKRAEANGHRLILIGASEHARKLFSLTGTEFLLDEGEAVSVLDQFTGGRARRRLAQRPSGDGDGRG
jgi:anti-sigma B factor antagonist